MQRIGSCRNPVMSRILLLKIIRHNYFNFIHVHDFLIRYNDSIIQLFYMWILDLQSHINHLEKVIQNKNNTL